MFHTSSFFLLGLCACCLFLHTHTHTHTLSLSLSFTCLVIHTPLPLSRKWQGEGEERLTSCFIHRLNRASRPRQQVSPRHWIVRRAHTANSPRIGLWHGMRQHRGTLVCVVLKGKHLVLKRVQDSQDPVAEVCVDGVRLRTLPDRRAGTSPLWDEQMHFEIYEDDDSDIDALHPLSEHDYRTALPSTGSLPKVHTLELICYATDKEPDYIGHATLDLSTALSRGEHDQWLILTNQGRVTGQVYVELTYYMLELPPKRASYQVSPRYAPPPPPPPPLSAASTPKPISPLHARTVSLDDTRFPFHRSIPSVPQPPRRPQHSRVASDAHAAMIAAQALSSPRREQYRTMSAHELIYGPACSAGLGPTNPTSPASPAAPAGLSGQHRRPLPQTPDKASMPTSLSLPALHSSPTSMSSTPTPPKARVRFVAPIPPLISTSMTSPHSPTSSSSSTPRPPT